MIKKRILDISIVKIGIVVICRYWQTNDGCGHHRGTGCYSIGRRVNNLYYEDFSSSGEFDLWNKSVYLKSLERIN